MTLNNMGVLLKGGLTHLCACNFLHVNISLHARCTHARQRAHNLSSPGGFGKQQGPGFIQLYPKYLETVVSTLFLAYYRDLFQFYSSLVILDQKKNSEKMEKSRETSKRKRSSTEGHSRERRSFSRHQKDSSNYIITEQNETYTV